MASNKVRDKGFEEVLKDYPQYQVNQLMAFHQENGGLSRYVKFRYFFEEVRNEPITDNEVNIWAEKFSKIMLYLLINKDLLIEETLNFIKNNFQKIPMIIVSGSDQNELRRICEGVEINQFFKRIHGSPKPKLDWVHEILKEDSLDPSSCVLIGDSFNDYEAASKNGIPFMAFNNPKINKYTNKYINFNDIY